MALTNDDLSFLDLPSKPFFRYKSRYIMKQPDKWEVYDSNVLKPKDLIGEEKYFLKALWQLLFDSKRKKEKKRIEKFFKCDEIMCSDEAINNRIGIISEEEMRESYKKYGMEDYDPLTKKIKIGGEWRTNSETIQYLMEQGYFQKLWL